MPISIKREDTVSESRNFPDSRRCAAGASIISDILISAESDLAPQTRA